MRNLVKNFELVYCNLVSKVARFHGTKTIALQVTAQSSIDVMQQIQQSGDVVYLQVSNGVM